jgi:hypothetical protein
MDELPESGRTEIEDCQRQIDGGVIVHQPPGHDLEQRLGDRQLAGGRRAMEEKQLHELSIS